MLAGRSLMARVASPPRRRCAGGPRAAPLSHRQMRILSMGLVGWSRPDVWSAASGGADTESHVRDGRRRAPFSPTAATRCSGSEVLKFRIRSSEDVVEIPTGLTPRAQVLQPLRRITASPVIPIGVPPLVVRSVQHTVGRAARQPVITARPASAGAGNRCDVHKSSTGNEPRSCASRIPNSLGRIRPVCVASAQCGPRRVVARHGATAPGRTVAACVQRALLDSHPVSAKRPEAGGEVHTIVRVGASRRCCCRTARRER